jgi:hypothetical protein
MLIHSVFNLVLELYKSRLYGLVICLIGKHNKMWNLYRCRIYKLIERFQPHAYDLIADLKALIETFFEEN